MSTETREEPTFDGAFPAFNPPPSALLTQRRAARYLCCCNANGRAPKRGCVYARINVLQKKSFLTRGGEGTSGGRVPPALGRPRAHGAGQGQRCEVLRRGEIVVSPGSRWPQLRTNSSPISPGLPSGSAAGPRTHGSAVEAPRTRVPVLHPCCRRQSKRKKKK